MKKRILACLLSACMMCALCACANADVENAGLTDRDDELDVSVYEDSEGKVHINYNLNDSSVRPVEYEGLIIHDTSEDEVSAPDGSISIEKAEEIIDRCSSSRLYLPDTIKNCKKFYNGTIKIKNKDYYSLSFYIENKGQMIFVGTDVFVACDGQDVYRKDIAGIYQTVKIGGASDDKEASRLYPDASITALDALRYVLELDSRSIGLEEELSAYTFEVADKLLVKKSVSCYKITPKLSYETASKICSPVFVAADGSERAFIYDSETDDYTKL